MSGRNELNRIRKGFRWGTIIKVILLIVCICFAAFTYVRITTDARVAFREAKNVRLAFQLMSIEYHGTDKEIYDAGSPDGMADGISDRLADFIDGQGQVRITAYNRRNCQVTGFVYTQGKYRVTYGCDKNSNEHWRVDYIINVLKFDEE